MLLCFYVYFFSLYNEKIYVRPHLITQIKYWVENGKGVMRAGSSCLT